MLRLDRRAPITRLADVVIGNAIKESQRPHQRLGDDRAASPTGIIGNEPCCRSLVGRILYSRRRSAERSSVAPSPRTSDASTPKKETPLRPVFLHVFSSRNRRVQSAEVPFRDARPQSFRTLDGTRLLRIHQHHAKLIAFIGRNDIARLRRRRAQQHRKLMQ